jgi:serine/threonine protein kinase
MSDAPSTRLDPDLPAAADTGGSPDKASTKKSTDPAHAAPGATTRNDSDLTRATVTAPSAARAAAPAVPEAPPGYEIVAEIGRGGMGVVYKARQLSLKRTVALKMILAGTHAGHDAVARFHAEAEAVARLQHPHIVQIHEISSHNGCPFFSLEYVDGGSLAARLKAGPPSQEMAADVVQKLARAMHHAHRSGIVHRDLKPGNVLLTGDGTPKVTDFGLAKNLDEDAGRTATNAVMGTPAYMAPEQASGRTRDAGPAVDIYALGAILYEMLTGKLPFQGKTVLETLELVRTREPEPPSRIRKVPADLETICLKCLAKAPADRYASALELAQDLERHSAGEPILARPESTVRRWRRRLYRNRLPLAIAAGVAVVLTAGAAMALHGLAAKSEAGLQREIDTALSQSDWPPERVDEVESLIGRLGKIAPADAEAARRRLVQELRGSLNRTLDRPHLEPDDVSRFETTLKALSAREAAAEEEFHPLLQQRLRNWDTVFDLKEPFADRASVFPAGVDVVNSRLVTANPPEGERRIAPSAAPCVGPVDAEAVFEPAAGTAKAFGLVLNAAPADPQKTGYAILLTLPPAARAGDGLTRNVQLLRNGVVVRQSEVRPAGGRVTLGVRREGDVLRVRVNGQEACTFIDAFALPAGQTVFGICCPPDAPLVRVQARHQLLPKVASDLESADDFFARGKYAEALDAYRNHARKAPTGASGTEARYKAAVCLAALKQPDEAARGFEQVAGEAGERWSAAAAGQLWLLRLRQDRLEEADTVFDSVAARDQFADLLAVLPEEDRLGIGSAYQAMTTGLTKLRAGPEELARAERFVRVMDFLQMERNSGGLGHLAWQRALEVAGRDADALRVGQDYLSSLAAEPPGERVNAANAVLIETMWLRRLRGEAVPALADLDRLLYASPGTYHAGIRSPVQPLLEHARLEAAAGHRDGLRHDLDETSRLLRQPGAVVDANSVSALHLMQGFLLERDGNHSAARAEWAAGTLKNWLKTVPERERADAEANLAAYIRLQQLVLAALSEELSDGEATQYLNWAVAGVGGDGAAAGLASLAGIHPMSVRRMWQSPRGREFAEKIAFRTVSFAEIVRTTPLLLVAEVIREQAFDNELSPDQEAVVWDMLREAFALYSSGKLGKKQAVQIGMTWKSGVTGFIGWDSVAPGLPPAMRGPLAYILAHRFVHLKMDEKAAAFLQKAADDSPKDSRLRRLARAELDGRR